MVEAIQGMDAVILGTEVFNRNVIDHADKLKIVSRYGVGLDKIDVEYLKEKGITNCTQCKYKLRSGSHHRTYAFSLSQYYKK